MIFSLYVGGSVIVCCRCNLLCCSDTSQILSSSPFVLENVFWGFLAELNGRSRGLRRYFVVSFSAEFTSEGRWCKRERFFSRGRRVAVDASCLDLHSFKLKFDSGCGGRLRRHLSRLHREIVTCVLQRRPQERELHSAALEMRQNERHGITAYLQPS